MITLFCHQFRFWITCAFNIHSFRSRSQSFVISIGHSIIHAHAQMNNTQHSNSNSISNPNFVLCICAVIDVCRHSTCLMSSTMCFVEQWSLLLTFYWLEHARIACICFSCDVIVDYFAVLLVSMLLSILAKHNNNNDHDYDHDHDHEPHTIQWPIIHQCMLWHLHLHFNLFAFALTFTFTFKKRKHQVVIII